MIKITRPSCPSELTSQVQQNLTNTYKMEGESVWNQPFIKSALFAMSHAKCCFCECALGEEAKYLEVEHFVSKTLRPDLVVDWDNLFPACRRCNARKGAHNVITDPIINPCLEDPRFHLQFHLYRFRGLTNLGISTEEVLQLNDSERLVSVRFKIGEKAQETLKCIRSSVELWEGKMPSIRRKNGIQIAIKGVLLEGIPESEYSATVATVIFNNNDYYWLKSELQLLDIWDQELTELDARVQSNSY